MTETPTIAVVWDAGADQSVALPTYETSGAAGADIRANLPVNMRKFGVLLQSMERRLIATGLRMEIPPGYEIQIRPRSGLALKHGLALVNAPGTIDSDYRGSIGIIMINLGAEPFRIEHGERIAQLVVAPVVQGSFRMATAVSETDRGSGGFGSTGRG